MFYFTAFFTIVQLSTEIKITATTFTGVINGPISLYYPSLLWESLADEITSSDVSLNPHAGELSFVTCRSILWKSRGQTKAVWDSNWLLRVFSQPIPELVLINLRVQRPLSDVCHRRCHSSYVFTLHYFPFRDKTVGHHKLINSQNNSKATSITAIR